MSLLVTGLMLWVVIHLFPSICKNTRATIVEKIGLMPYKGLFAILILLSMVLIVIGWQSISPEDIYIPAAWGRYITFILVLLTFILFVAAKRKTNIKRVLRHPQLTGLVLWSIGHMFANEDNRSVILFTALGIWAILEIIMINKREGVWKKPEAVPMKSDVITVTGGFVLYAALIFAHPYITGIKLM
ncbi:MAG: NnrU family protein [Proteobacteria bacterium]|nr:hypothetical protein [Pseudomonadota bacterium]NOG60666.1 NnrU family protein [Pseudomonadota bacterium]